MIAALVATTLLAAGAGDDPGPAAVRFSPGRCTAEMVEQIGRARRSIRGMAYTFTSRPVADALLAAHARGVDVRLLLDAREAQERGGQGPRLAACGVPVGLDARHAIFHHKVLVVDGRTTLTGSFNWTAAAERRNAENLRVQPADPLAADYLAEFARHAAHATPLAVPLP